MPRRPKNRASSAGGEERVGAGREKAAPANSRGRWWPAAFVLLPAIFLAQGAWSIAANSQTYDEAVNLCAGYSYLADGDFRFNAEHPPLMKELAALPLWLCYRLPLPTDMLSPKWDAEWVAGRRFLYQNAASGPSAERMLNLARVPNLMLGTLLVGLVGLWSYRLWGRGGGLLGMALAAFDPNLVAHASLATNDLGLAFFAFLTLYWLWKYTGSRSRSWGQLVAVGLALGLALASKFSAVSLIGILAVVAGAEMFSGNSLRLPAGAGPVAKNKRIGGRLAEAGAAMGIVFGIAFLVLWSTYFFHSLAACCHGLWLQIDHQQGGHPAFLMGRYSDAGWPHYFLIALLLKTPLATLILIAASFVLCRAGRPLGLRGSFYLAVPVALVLAAATAARIDIGIRLILLIYPLLYVAAARLATVRIRRAWIVPWLAGGLAALSAISSLRAAPYELSYFSELVGGPAGGLRYLGDSNLDWGQGLRELKAYMDRERTAALCLSYFGTALPEDYGIRCQYAPSMGEPPPNALPEKMDRDLLAVSATNLQGIYLGNKELYRWLLKRKPAAVIGSSIYVYDLTGDAEALWLLANVYLEAGPARLAIPELRKVVKMRPNDAAAHNNLGVVLASQHRMDEAIEQFREAARLRPGDASAQQNLGRALAERGRLDEAVKQYRRALQDNPDCAEIHDSLGDALSARGEPAEAAVHYRKALELAIQQHQTALADSVKRKLPP
jgi:tetratricopeptide (TPR) repeat protein